VWREEGSSDLRSRSDRFRRSGDSSAEEGVDEGTASVESTLCGGTRSSTSRGSLRTEVGRNEQTGGPKEVRRIEGTGSRRWVRIDDTSGRNLRAV